MGDRGGRGGRGRGRGGGGAGYQEGPGQGRGNRGDGGGGRGAGRGEFWGGQRGRGGRGSRGGQGMSPFGGDAPGGYRGGQGGYSGGKAAKPIEIFQGYGDGVPTPDTNQKQLEDKLMDVKSGLHASQLAIKDTQLMLPTRPAWGTKGNNVVLWANYFNLSAKPKKPLLKYTLDIKKLNAEGAEVPLRVGQTTLPQRLLHKIIAQLLTILPRDNVYATEYKSQLIARDSIAGLDADNSKRIQLAEQAQNGMRTTSFRIIFGGPNTVDIADLHRVLTDQTDPSDPDDRVFPRMPVHIDALNVMLGHSPRTDPQITAIGAGRFFNWGQHAERGLLGRMQNLEILRGYSQSVRPATGRLLLNVQVTHAIMRRPGNVADFLSGHPRFITVTSENLIAYHQIFKQARAKCQMGQGNWAEKTLAGFARRGDGHQLAKPTRFANLTNHDGFAGPTQTSFYLGEPMRNGQPTNEPPPPGMQWNRYYTVSDYFQLRYNLTCNGELPLINVGNAANPVYLPAEMVEVLPGQPKRGVLKADQAQDMIKFACRKPDENAHSISETGTRILKHAGNALLRSFGIDVGSRLITVNARQLMCPRVSYLDSQSRTSQKKIMSTTPNASWNMTGAKFHKPGEAIDPWTWMIVRSERNHADKNACKKQIDALQAFARKSLGLSWSSSAVDPDGLEVLVNERNCEDVVGAVFRKLKERDRPVKYAFVILAADNWAFDAVKLAGDVTYGIRNICTQQNKFTRMRNGNPDLTFFSNLGLKLNLKSGGVNHQLEPGMARIITEGKTMLIGYDVIHPTGLGFSKDTTAPSQVGLVQSVDAALGQWPAQYWVQEPKKEMLGNQLCDAIKICLDRWSNISKRAKAYPENIVIYRDGVSEGQFSTVLDQELPNIRQACRDKYGKQKVPNISIIVSVKRHATRFYPSTVDTASTSSNIKPGTVVDRGVTQARYWEFFLAAHHALQGTTRTARYIVLLDEVFRATAVKNKGNAADDLEKLTHDLCYMFGRATKAVSICPPAYYADIVCTRAKCHMKDLFTDDDSQPQQTNAQQSAAREARRQAVLARRPHRDVADCMFYI